MKFKIRDKLKVKMICIILVAGHETNLDQEIHADQTGQYRHLEGKCV